MFWNKHCFDDYPGLRNIGYTSLKDVEEHVMKDLWSLLEEQEPEVSLTSWVSFYVLTSEYVTLFIEYPCVPHMQTCVLLGLCQFNI